MLLTIKINFFRYNLDKPSDSSQKVTNQIYVNIQPTQNPYGYLRPSPAASSWKLEVEHKLQLREISQLNSNASAEKQ